MNLQLITSREFNGFTLDCYVEPEQTDKGAFWATRTQIGQLLGYAEPGIAIGKIHQRNQERLDKFSRVHQIDLPSGGTQSVTIYNFKGLLEICRYSQQETANAVIDVLWDIADEIRRTGSYKARPDEEALKRKDRELDVRKAELLQSMIGMCPMTDETKTVFIHEAYKALTGNTLLSMLPSSTEKWYSATDIGEIVGISSNKVGRIAKKNGLKAPEGESNEYGRWIFSKSQYSSRECPTFIYNVHALDWFKKHLAIGG